MSFNESNTVEQMILDALCSCSGGSGGALAMREDHSGSGGSLGGESGKGCR
jgi:GTPase involved in cell partitioning and DNA repair